MQVCECLVHQIENGGNVPAQCVMETLGCLATSNVSLVMPFIKPILVLIVPTLSHVKQDGLKVALASMFSKFCETILDAVANKKPDSQLNVAEYSNECDVIYDSLVNLWLRSSNPAVRNETILSLGHMSHIVQR